MVAQYIETVIERLTIADLYPCWELDQICFQDGEAYNHETLRYLLTNPHSVSFKLVESRIFMVGFVLGLVEQDTTGHVIALGVDPDSRQRGYGRLLMEYVESGFRYQGVTISRLEVRVSNRVAQRLYMRMGYTIVERLLKYYSNGEDAYLMIKSLFDESYFTK
ncbi:MAG: GNAT family N-acetyltransferase [Blastocatellia bacterium]|nr:GNAT family N-acetyltransferase [Blastocatellia bacterium]